MFNGNDGMRSGRHFVFVQSKSAGKDRTRIPFIIVVVVVAEHVTARRYRIIVTGGRSCGTEHHRPAPEFDLVEELHVGYSIVAITRCIDKRIYDARGPAHDRRQDMNEWHIDLLVKDIGEHQRNKAEQEAQEDG